jgi:DNA-binding response OmpR family regulator
MKNILIVEDEKHLGSVYEKFLNQEGFPAKWVEGISGIKKLDSDFKPDVVLLDEGLPDEERGGIGILPELKTVFPKAKFVVFSNYSAFDLEKKALAAGADAYWVKVDIRLGSLPEKILNLFD